MIVAGVDPGLLTGTCLVQFDTPDGCTLLQAAEVEFENLLAWCEVTLPKADRLVVEQFIINARTIKNTQAPFSLEAIGVVRAIQLRTPPLKLDMQSATEGKSLVDNKMLRRLGLWFRGGEGHANDAIRHTVAYAIRKGWRDPRMMPPDA